MGLFGKRENSKGKKEAANFEDINPLNMNSLINAFKKQKPNATEKDVLNFVKRLAEPDDDQEHLTPDGDLPWGWFTVHKDDIERIEGEYKRLWQIWFDSRNKSPKEYAVALEQFVYYMMKAKKICTDKGECFNYWRGCLFTDDYLQKLYDELENLNANFDEINAKYNIDKQVKVEIVPKLRDTLESIIKDNQSILQTEVYKMFQPEAKTYISEELYSMERDGKIIREKSGKTYKLSLK